MRISETKVAADDDAGDDDDTGCPANGNVSDCSDIILHTPILKYPLPSKYPLVQCDPLDTLKGVDCTTLVARIATSTCSTLYLATRTSVVCFMLTMANIINKHRATPERSTEVVYIRCA